MRRPRAAEPRRVSLRAGFERVPDTAAPWGGDGLDDALRDAVRAALDTVLTARQREIVEWHFFEGASQGEIARRLGVTQQVVQKSLYGVTRGGKPVGGAMRRLRDALAPVVRLRT